MAKQVIQRVPLLWLVIPLIFLVDDQLRNRLRMGLQADGCLQFLGGHFAVAVAVDDVEQAALDRSLVFSVGHEAVAFELRFVEVADVAVARGRDQGVEPRQGTDFFAYPAIEAIPVTNPLIKPLQYRAFSIISSAKSILSPCARALEIAHVSLCNWDHAFPYFLTRRFQRRNA